MASCDPLRDTQRFEAMREALRRVTSPGDDVAPVLRGTRTIRLLPLKRRAKS
jgi:hypothetical protein